MNVFRLKRDSGVRKTIFVTLLFGLGAPLEKTSISTSFGFSGRDGWGFFGRGVSGMDGSGEQPYSVAKAISRIGFLIITAFHCINGGCIGKEPFDSGIARLFTGIPVSRL